MADPGETLHVDRDVDPRPVGLFRHDQYPNRMRIIAVKIRRKNTSSSIVFLLMSAISVSIAGLAVPSGRVACARSNELKRSTAGVMTFRPHQYVKTDSTSAKSHV